jgi:serine/threonine-protein kinase OSR1/STK39
MAPEVIAQKQYDASADIWSLGITALELCNGRAPHSRDTPTRILQKILHNDPPTLDRKAGKHIYSREFKEVIERCLVKDPTQRPTAAELLETPFFKGAKRKSHLVSTLIGINLYISSIQ